VGSYIFCVKLLVTAHILFLDVIDIAGAQVICMGTFVRKASKYNPFKGNKYLKASSILECRDFIHMDLCTIFGKSFPICGLYIHM